MTGKGQTVQRRPSEHQPAHPDRSSVSDDGRQPVIVTTDLGKRYGQRWAVKGLGITVPAGTICGFVGPNGAGKTTTIRLLLGLVRPTTGDASVLGHSIDEPARYLARVGALIEGPAFYPSLNGRENLKVLARLGGLSDQRVGEVLELAGLSARAKDAVQTYSLGMRQRLGIAAALLPKPALLVLDEPANGLDPQGIQATRDLLRSLRDQGTSIFVSSHLLAEVEQLADWLVVLNDGRALFCGPPSAIPAHQEELVVVSERLADLEVVAALAAGHGYRARTVSNAVRIVCPPTFAGELNRLSMAAGVTLVELRYERASLEETFFEIIEGSSLVPRIH